MRFFVRAYQTLKILQLLRLFNSVAVLFIISCKQESVFIQRPIITSPKTYYEVNQGDTLHIQQIFLNAEGLISSLKLNPEIGKISRAGNGLRNSIAFYKVLIDEQFDLGNNELSFTLKDRTGQMSFLTINVFVSEPSSFNRKQKVFISDDIVVDTEFTNNNEYFVDGIVFVDQGAILKIQKGTVIRFFEQPTTSEYTSALVISKDSKIEALGTAENPIIFTAERDNLKTKLEENNQVVTGLWGGLIILGNAPVTGIGETSLPLKGIDERDKRGLYGGTDENDSSGILKYISIRYSGAEAIDGKSNSLRSFTLAGVGSNTQIEFVEVFASLNDGIHIIGGNFDARYLAIPFAFDDDIDIDFGYTGSLQYIFSMKDQFRENSDHILKVDGATSSKDPVYSTAKIANWTAIGGGQNGQKRMIRAENWFAGSLYNSIFLNGIKALAVEDAGHPFDPYRTITKRREFNGFDIRGCIFSNFSEYNSDFTDIVDAYNNNDLTKDEFLLDGTINPNYHKPEKSDLINRLKNNSYENEYMEDQNLFLQTNGNNQIQIITQNFIQSNILLPSQLEQNNHRGAFKPFNKPWIYQWTTLDQLGYLKKQ